MVQKEGKGTGICLAFWVRLSNFRVTKDRPVGLSKCSRFLRYCETKGLSDLKFSLPTFWQLFKISIRPKTVDNLSREPRYNLVLEPRDIVQCFLKKRDNEHSTYWKDHRSSLGVRPCLPGPSHWLWLPWNLQTSHSGPVLQRRSWYQHELCIGLSLRHHHCSRIHRPPGTSSHTPHHSITSYICI